MIELRAQLDASSVGVFDLLHANHIDFLEEAKSFGGWLLVGVVSDARAQDYKRRRCCHIKSD